MSKHFSFYVAMCVEASIPPQPFLFENTVFTYYFIQLPSRRHCSLTSKQPRTHASSTRSSQAVSHPRTTQAIVRLATVNSKWVNSIDPFWNLWALLNIAIMMLISFFFAVIGKTSEIKLSTTTSWKWNFALSVSLDSFQLQAIVREERKSNQKLEQSLNQKCPSWKL